MKRMKRKMNKMKMKRTRKRKRKKQEWGCWDDEVSSSQRQPQKKTWCSIQLPAEILVEMIVLGCSSSSKIAKEQDG